MKKKGFGLVAVCISVVAAVLSFVALAFNWYALVISSESLPATRADWAHSLESSASQFGAWRASRVFMIITLVVVAIVAVLLIVELFYENKLLAQIAKWASLALIVLVAIFLILFVVGCVNLSGSSMLVMPHAGPIALTAFAVLTGVFGMLANKKKKA